MKKALKIYHILINENSGGVSRMEPEALNQIFAKTELNIKTLDILPPQQFFQKLERLKESNAPLLIGGGDGTIKSAAEILMKSKKPFGIIPLGTMNLMAHDLGIPTEIDEALEAYAHQTREIKTDVGMINDYPFLCCVGVGTMPEGSEFREKNREQNTTFLIPRMTVFILNQMDRIKHRVMRMSIDGKPKKLKTAALVISNNQYRPQNEWNENNFTRPSLNNGKLGLYSAAPYSLWDRIRIILRLKYGNWRKDPVIDEWQAETVSLQTKRAQELVSLDGETQTLQTPLNFWIEPKALHLLVPQNIEKKNAA